MENKLWLETEDVHENLDKPQDECGGFGIYRKEGKGVVADTYHALYALQHRGQDSCGMCVNTDGVMKKYRESGLVTDVFTRDMLEKIEEGNMALGPCRSKRPGGGCHREAAAAIPADRNLPGAGCATAK